MPYPTQSETEEALLSLIYFRGGSDFKVKCSDTYRPLADYFQLTEQEKQILRTSEGNERKRKWDSTVCYARRALRGCLRRKKALKTYNLSVRKTRQS